MNDSSKYLIILAGSPRGGEHTWKSVKKFVINKLSADVAICTGKNFLKNQSFLSYANYDWSFDEPKNWSDYYIKNYPKKWQIPFSLGKNTGLYESGLIHLAIKDIIFKNYLEIINSYDFIIYTRFDQLHLNYHLHGIEDKILIPDGEDYFGICDRHALIPKKYTKEFFGTIDFFFNNFKNFQSTKYLNCETLNMYHLHSFIDPSKILRFKRQSFTVSTKNDLTNWRIPKYRLYLFNDLLLKYPDEFLYSMKYWLKNFNFLKLDKNNIRFLINYYYLNLRSFIGLKIKTF